MHKQKLLINLGAGRGWLMNRHKELRIEYWHGSTQLSFLTDPEIKLLKLREIHPESEE